MQKNNFLTSTGNVSNSQILSIGTWAKSDKKTETIFEKKFSVFKKEFLPELSSCDLPAVFSVFPCPPYPSPFSPWRPNRWDNMKKPFQGIKITLVQLYKILFKTYKCENQTFSEQNDFFYEFIYLVECM